MYINDLFVSYMVKFRIIMQFKESTEIDCSFHLEYSEKLYSIKQVIRKYAF